MIDLHRSDSQSQSSVSNQNLGHDLEEGIEDESEIVQPVDAVMDTTDDVEVKDHELFVK